MSGTVDTKPLPVVQPPRRRRRPLVVALVVLLVVVVLAVVAFLIGDGVFRGYAEKQIDRSVTSNLPQGVTGTVRSTIEGPFPILQWLHGSFDDVRLTSNDLRIHGGAARAHLEVHGLPVDGSGRVDSATGSLTVSQASLKDLAPLQSANATAPRLGAGTVSTSVQRTILGVPITVAVTLVPGVQGKYVHLDPTKATLTSGALSVPGTALIRTLLPDGINVCAAKYLPPSVQLTGITVRHGSATLDLSAQALDLGALQRGVTGHC